MGDVNVLDRIKELREDPDLFDGREQLAALKVMIEELLLRYQESEYKDTKIEASLIKLIGLFIKGQQTVAETLAGRGFYLTLAQADDMIRKLGTIFNQALDSPEVAQALGANLKKQLGEKIAERIHKEVTFPEEGTYTT